MLDSFFGTTTKVKWIYTAVWALLFFAIYGMLSSVIILPVVGAALNILGWIISLSISIPLIYLMSFSDSSPFIRAGFKKPFHRLLIAHGYFALVYLFMFLIFERGIPIILHQFMKQEQSTLVVTIESLNASDRKCVGGVYIKEGASFIDNKLCGIPLDISKKLDVGDKLTLHGQKSLVGFSHEYTEAHRPSN